MAEATFVGAFEGERLREHSYANGRESAALFASDSFSLNPWITHVVWWPEGVAEGRERVRFDRPQDEEKHDA